MAEAPDDLDRPLALVVLEVGGAEIREGDRRGIALPHVPGEEQDRVSPLRLLERDEHGIGLEPGGVGQAVGLLALALLVAESDPGQKDLTIRLILNLLEGANG